MVVSTEGYWPNKSEEEKREIIEASKFRTLTANQISLGYPIVMSPNLRTMNLPSVTKYCDFARNNHAYWAVVYKNPKRMNLLKRERQAYDANPEIIHRKTLSGADVARLPKIHNPHDDLSWEALAVINKHSKGIEILRHHEDNRNLVRGEVKSRTYGCVVGSEQDPITGTLRFLLRPYDSDKGRELAHLVESRYNRAVSLHTSELDVLNIVQVPEVSITDDGLREGTEITDVVDVSSMPPLEKNSRLFKRGNIREVLASSKLAPPPLASSPGSSLPVLGGGGGGETQIDSLAGHIDYLVIGPAMPEVPQT